MFFKTLVKTSLTVWIVLLNFFSAEMTGPTKFIKKKQNFKLER